MKKIISIILTLIICLSLVSCNVTTPPQSTATATPENNETTSPKTKEKTEEVITFEYPEVIEYGVYTSGTDSVFKQDALVDGTLKRISKISVRAESFLNSPLMSPSVLERINNGISELKMNSFLGNEVDYNVISSCFQISDFSECINPYVKDDTIVKTFVCNNIEENKKFNVTINIETEKILSYSRLYGFPKEGNFTMEEAKKKAVEIAEAEFGKDALDDYIVGFEQTREDRLVVWYSRKIGDYLTIDSDCIKFVFDLNGEILAYSAQCFGKLEGVLNMLTEENLKNAENTLRATFKEGAKIDDEKNIVIDNITGVCYIKLSVGLDSYYINIY